jgi:hypothetical protein
MRALGWIARLLQLDKPIAGRERSIATVCGLLLLLGAAGLILTSPTHSAVGSSERARPRTLTLSASGTAPRRSTAAVGAHAKATAERFLAGYLAYVYGRAPASRVRDATVAFAGSLEHQPQRVPPGIRALRPRLVSVTVSLQGPGRVIASALVSDAEVVHYPIRLLLTDNGAGWRVSGLESTP